MRRAALSFVFLLAPIVFDDAPSTVNNDDSCDIGLYPAATLLLPYFEVETAKRGTDTLFTITNVGHLPQIAHVTIWTDWGFPVLTFPIFLTGYDVQSISLYDVIVNGIIAPGSSPGTSSLINLGSQSASNSANPNITTQDCGALAGVIAPTTRAAMQRALVMGIDNAPGFSGCGTVRVGSDASTHLTANMADGYVTIDVVSRCSSTSPANPEYFTNEILFDNVLTGDFMTIRKEGIPYSSANPLVHIRAVPEGGPAGMTPLPNTAATPLPYTFYGRYINGQTISNFPITPHLDRRQPLGSTFAARWANDGSVPFGTNFKIWREGVAGSPSCQSVLPNSALHVKEFVRFDEHENPTVILKCTTICVGPIQDTLPSTSSMSTTNTSLFPPTLTTPGDRAGWMFLNLDSGVSEQTINRLAHPDFPQLRASQNWVVVSMMSGPAATLAAEFDATSLGNGCSPPAAISVANKGTATIGPAGGVLVCPLGFTIGISQACTPAYTGTNANP